MFFKDFRDYLDNLEKNGLLLRVKKEVNPKYEIAAGIRKISDTNGSFTGTLDNYDSFKGNPYGSEAKAKFLQYMYSLLEAGENRNKSLSESITVQLQNLRYT